MDEREIAQVLTLIPESLADIRQSIERFAQNATLTGRSPGKLFGFLPRSTVEATVFDQFRDSPWFVSAFGDTIDGQLGTSIVVQRKKFIEDCVLSQANYRCYHVTESKNLTGILRQGLLTGRAIGVEPKSAKWRDAPHYVHASLTIQDAQSWATILYAQQSCLIIPINLAAEPKLQLFKDPGSRNPLTGECNGFIIDRNHVPPNYLLLEEMHVANDPHAQ